MSESRHIFDVSPKSISRDMHALRARRRDPRREYYAQTAVVSRPVYITQTDGRKVKYEGP